MKIHCFDTVSLMLEEARRRFPGSDINPEAYSIIENDCDILDNMVEEFECESIEAKIDDRNIDLSITLSMFDMTLQDGRSHKFFDVIQHTKEFSFCSNKEDMISVCFVYDKLLIPKEI